MTTTIKAPTVRDYLFAWGLPVPPEGEATLIDPDAAGQIGHAAAERWRKPISNDPWPFTPENCGYAGYWQGYWTADGSRLFCPGCGLDCT